MGDFENALKAYSRASNLAPGIAGYRLKQALVLFEVSGKPCYLLHPNMWSLFELLFRLLLLRFNL